MLRRGGVARAFLGVVGVGLLVSGAQPGAVAPASAASGAGSVGVGSGVPEGSRAGGPHVESWWYDALRLSQAHREVTGAGVRIAVIDGGLNLDIPELAGADIEMMPSPCNGGRRAVSDSGVSALHGTRIVAMLVGNGDGVGGPGTGVLGVAPDATILFYDHNSLDDPGDGTYCGEQQLARSLGSAAENADVVSTSWGGSDTPPIARVLRRIVTGGETVLVAAPEPKGSHVPEVPSSWSGVVSVNALDRAAEPWSESTTFADEPYPEAYDKPFFVPVTSAPGVEVEGPGVEDGSWATVPATGTSYAAPIVAGAVALTKEKYPQATSNELIQHLMHYTSTKKLAWYEGYGFGVLRLRDLLSHDPRLWPDVNPLTEGPLSAVRRFPSGSDQDPSLIAVEDGGTGEPTATESEPEQAAGGATGQAPGSTASPSASTVAGEEQEESAQPADPGGSAWVWSLGVAGVVVLGAGVVWGVRRRGARNARTS